MDKKEFIDRLLLAGDKARKFAESLDYVKEKLPENLIFTIFEYNDPNGRQSEDGKLKFLGGKFLDPKELKCLSASKAASLLWVDGRIPSWINISAIDYTSEATEMQMMFSKHLVKAEVENLYPDYGMEPNNPLLPFRLRGPSLEEWQKAGKNA